MKRISLAVLVLGVTVAACSEVATSPETVTAPVSLAYSNPPPPDVDTMAAGTADGQTYFTLQVRYFFNPVGNAGWLKFDSEDGDVSVDKNAQVRYSQDVFSGKGFLTLTESSGSKLVIDLSTVEQTSTFTSCSAPETAPTSTDDTRTEGGCFSVSFSGLTRNGISTVGRFVLVPDCGTSSDGEIVPCVRPRDPTDS